MCSFKILLYSYTSTIFISVFLFRSGATYPRYRGRKVPAVQSRLITEAPRLIDEVVVES